MQRTSTAGLVEIASHEGIVTSRYKDSVGVWTIGIGHTANAGDPDPARVSRELSIAEVMEIFQRDIAKFEARVRKAFTRPLTQHQFDAAVSFDFNLGRIHDATWVKRFNAGDIAGARTAFMWFKKPPEIIPRRRKERDLFFDGKYTSGGKANVYPAQAGRVVWSLGKRVDVASLLSHKPAPVPEHQTEQESVPRGNTGRNSGIALIVATIGGAAAMFWDKIEAAVSWPWW